MIILTAESIGLSMYDILPRNAVVLKSEYLNQQQIYDYIYTQLQSIGVLPIMLTVVLNESSLFINLITDNRRECSRKLYSMFPDIVINFTPLGSNYPNYSSMEACLPSIHGGRQYNRIVSNLQHRLNQEVQIVGNHFYVYNLEKDEVIKEITDLGHVNFRFVDQSSYTRLPSYNREQEVPVSAPIAIHDSQNTLVESITIQDKTLVLTFTPAFLEQLFLLMKQNIGRQLCVEINGVIYGFIPLRSDRLKKQVPLTSIEDMEHVANLRKQIAYPLESIKFVEITKPRGNLLLILVLALLFLLLAAVYLLLIRRKYILTFAPILLTGLYHMNLSSLLLFVGIMHLCISIIGIYFEKESLAILAYGLLNFILYMGNKMSIIFITPNLLQFLFMHLVIFTIVHILTSLITSLIGNGNK